MGHVLATYITHRGSDKPLHLNDKLRDKIDALNTIATNTAKLTEREKKHVDALHMFSRG